MPAQLLRAVKMGQKAVFLDRDGVLDIDKGYLYKAEELVWVPESREAVGWLCSQGYLVLVATNQSGVARGMYTEADVHKLHAFMNKELAPYGGRIEHFYYCPHYKGGLLPRYMKECNCRKPKPGMILRGLTEWQGDPAASFLIGDKESDIAAATAAGITGYLFTGSNLLEFVKQNIPGIVAK